MRAHFERLSEALIEALPQAELLNCSFEAEQSDFVRFNQGRVRQAGHVVQASLQLQLIHGQRHASGALSLTGDPAQDRSRALQIIDQLRAALPCLPEDPHLLLPEQVCSSEQAQEAGLPESSAMAEAVLQQCEGLDLVGLLTSGPLYRGFASSSGQRNWFSTSGFLLDFSLYQRADKALKCSLAGKRWSPEQLSEKLQDGREKLAVLARPPRRIEPGRYRAYLAPSALVELLGLLSWGGFGLREQRTRRSPLLRAADGDARFDPRVQLREHVAGGVAPGFGAAGFPRPASIPLIEEGRLVGSLVSPRSAREYGIPTNGASPSETPDSLEMAPGELPSSEILQRLGTGLCVHNLWYLNYSDRAACRITGMTRFATFWVENGEIVAPLEVMRFDDCLYRMLGEGLRELTSTQALIPASDTYGGRSTTSTRLPGALIDDLVLTL